MKGAKEDTALLSIELLIRQKHFDLLKIDFFFSSPVGILQSQSWNKTALEES